MDGNKIHILISKTLLIRGVVVFAIFFLLILPSTFFAAEGEVTSVRKFKDSNIEKIVRNGDFFYLEQEESNQNIFYGLRKWIFQMLNYLLGSQIARGLFSNFHLIILFIALLLLILKINKLSTVKIFYNTKKIPLGNVFIDEQFIETIDFAELIGRALQQKNYRLALRYHYLELLKTLADKDIIEWNKNKTNSEIVHELRDRPFRDRFRSIALLFEYVWYGEFEISKTKFDEVRTDFLQLKKQIVST